MPWDTLLLCGPPLVIPVHPPERAKGPPVRAAGEVQVRSAQV